MPQLIARLPRAARAHHCTLADGARRASFTIMTMSVMSSHVEPCCTCYFYQRAQSLKGERGVSGATPHGTAAGGPPPRAQHTTVDSTGVFSNPSSCSCFQIRVISFVSLNLSLIVNRATHRGVVGVVCARFFTARGAPTVRVEPNVERQRVSSRVSGHGSPNADATGPTNKGQPILRNENRIYPQSRRLTLSVLTPVGDRICIGSAVCALRQKLQRSCLVTVHAGISRRSSADGTCISRMLQL
jgi:hypothetical protein